MSVTAAAGFVASGVACGIKPDGRLDLALVATADHRPGSAAAVFTTNKATAAPVAASHAHLRASRGRAAAVVLNSGNANAATGADGLAVAERTCRLVADQLGCEADEVLVCSTGLIGIPLPVGPIEAGVGPLAAALSAEGAGDAAQAILTTDSCRKEVVVRHAAVTVGGMAKGAAMLAPDMATMLAVLTTDAAVSPVSLRTSLAAAVEASFNCLSVDGCTSTNDTVIVLASGRAGPAAPQVLESLLQEACVDLAHQMADDAEGSTKTVSVRVTGAASTDEARLAARRVAESQLVKCSWYGGDPYWGRIVSELGSAGVEFKPYKVSVAYGGTVVCRRGVAAPHDEAAVRAHMAGRRLDVHADLGLGDGTAVVLTNDLTHGYVDENMATS